MFCCSFVCAQTFVSQKTILQSLWKDKVVIGEIIAWPFKETKISDEWLECNGQPVDQEKYPKLFQFMQKTPDFTQSFLYTPIIKSKSQWETIKKIENDPYKYFSKIPQNSSMLKVPQIKETDKDYLLTHNFPWLKHIMESTSFDTTQDMYIKKFLYFYHPLIKKIYKNTKYIPGPGEGYFYGKEFYNKTTFYDINSTIQWKSNVHSVVEKNRAYHYKYSFNSDSDYTHPKFVRIRYFIRAK